MVSRPLIMTSRILLQNARPHRVTESAVLTAPHRSLRPGTRCFSLWPSKPSSSTATPSPDITSPSFEPTARPKPPTMAELSLPASLPDPSFWEPLSTVLITLPSTLHLSWPLFIPLLTILIRASTSLPIQLWQRRQIGKFAKIVKPELEKRQRALALKVRDQCRRKGMGYDEYKKEFEKQAKEEARTVYRQFRFFPKLTLYAPPLLNLPIFIIVSLLIRDACTNAVRYLPFSAVSTTDSLPPHLTLETLSHLQELATTSFLWCPSLCLNDSTMFLPLFVGLATFTNVEVSARMRRLNNRRIKAVDSEEDVLTSPGSKRPEGGGRVLTASEMRRIAISRSRIRNYSSSSSSTTTTTTKPHQAAVNRIKTSEEEEVEDVEPRNQRILTNALRIASVAFIPIAALAPAGVCLYWLTSNLLTLITNLSFASIDRKELLRNRREKILGLKK